MTAFILIGARDLVARVKRVAATRSIMMFSNSYTALVGRADNQAQTITTLRGNEKLARSFYAMRTNQRDEARTKLDAAERKIAELEADLVAARTSALETVSSLEADIEALKQARAADAVAMTASAGVGVERNKLLNGMLDVLRATNAVKKPNGTTQKVARIANAALA